MGHERKMTIKPMTGVPTNTASRLTRDFLLRHGAELDDLLRRFPSASEREFHAAIERHVCEGASNEELVFALENACDQLLSLRAEDFCPQPGDAGLRLNIDAGLRWYAARFRDLAKAAAYM